MIKKIYLILILCLVFLTSLSYADPIKIYEIYNLTSFEFENKTQENMNQCQKFSNIPPGQKVSKVIDFEEAKEINCTAIVKNHPSCGMHIKLIPRSLLEVTPFGDCSIQTKSQKNTQRIDKLFIGKSSMKRL